MANERLQVVIEIQRHQGRCRATRRIGTVPNTQWLDDLQFNPDSPLRIKDQDHLLQEPLDVLVKDGGGTPNAALEFFFDEQGQFELGAYLYRQLFAGLTSDEERALERADLVDLVIVTSDPFAARLPWVLLVRKNHFLAAGRWSIALAAGGDVLARSCELPASPKLLVVCPNPHTAQFPDTQADEHLQELEAALRARDPLLAQGRRMLVARTWDECRQLLRQQQPEVLYYYGHGEGDAAKSRLIFLDSKGRPRPVPVAELAHCLSELPLKPLVAYVNCCHGDAGGALNVGGQLAEIIPAVVTNRTVAFLTQARAQAKRFWEETLLFATAPHDAVRQLYGLIDEPEFTLRNPRWMTPVFYRGYGVWKATPVRDASVILDPYWREKIDREHQFGMAFAQTTRMLRDERPRGVAFVWFGTEHDGMERFHERLKVDLGDMLPEGVKLIEYRPHWPPEMRAAEPDFDPVPSFREMLAQAFDVRALDDVASRVRRQVGADARKTLVYIRHQVITRPDDINGWLLRQYLLWWDRQLGTMLAPGQFCLLGISYQSQNPLQFADVVHSRLELECLPYQHGLCRILPPLGRIEEVHLRDFVRTHKITIPEEGRSELLRGILQRTEGRYDAVIRELEGLVERGFADVIKTEGTTAQEDWKLV